MTTIVAGDSVIQIDETITLEKDRFSTLAQFLDAAQDVDPALQQVINPNKELIEQATITRAQRLSNQGNFVNL